MSNYLKYWTGIKSVDTRYNKFDCFKIRCYFDNDSDELINYKGKNGLVDLDVYREMVRSLKVMGYNAIDIHDQLGRAEFYLWDSYKKYWDYKPDINHIEKIINIIHEEGLKVQIPMYLAWAFKPLNEKHECWVTHKKTWISTWKEYMNSPLGKGDIFLLRPRSPIYDCKYRCNCDKCVNLGTAEIMTQVFNEIEKIILSKKSDANLICDLYAEGYELFKKGMFKVSKNWLLLYANNGFGKFIHTETYANASYKKGIYLHSGFWLNHTIMEPHLDSLTNSIKKAKELNLTDYILVNGQSFKNFIINIEAIMSMCHEGDKFSKKLFLTDWIKRVLSIKDEKTISKIIVYIDKLANFHIDMAVRDSYLSPGKDVDRGFQANMINVFYPLIYKLNKKANDNYILVDEKFSTRKKEVLWKPNKAFDLYDKGLKLLIEVKEIELLINSKKAKIAFNDQFTFPMELLIKQLELIKMFFEVLADEMTIDDVKTHHKEFYNLAVNGSKFEEFSNWYHPKNSRMHHPIPTLEIYET